MTRVDVFARQLISPRQAGLTQEELAHALSESHSAIAAVEAGRTRRLPEVTRSWRTAL